MTEKNSCPKFESEKWNKLKQKEKEECRKSRLTSNTSKYFVFNTFNMIIIAVIGGFVFALALMIITDIQTTYIYFPVYLLALIIFGIIILFALAQFFTEKRKDYYQRQL